jgi:hypothetical protein
MRNCTIINKGKYPFLILVRLYNQIKKIANLLTEFYKPKMKIYNKIKVIFLNNLCNKYSVSAIIDHLLNQIYKIIVYQLKIKDKFQ